MLTPIIGGGIYSPSESEVNYNPLWGHSGWGTDPDVFFYQVMPCSGELSHLIVTTRGSPGDGKSFTITVYKNGAATELAVTITGGLWKEENITSRISVSAGDRVCIQCTPSGSPAMYSPKWIVLFKASTANQGVLLACSEPGVMGILDSATTEYAPIATGGQRLGADPTYYYSVVPTGGTFKGARGYLSAAPDPGDSGGYTFTLYKNGIVTDITFSITGDNTTATVTEDVSFSAGDYLYWKIVPNSPTVASYFSVSLIYQPTILNEGMVLGSTYDSPHATNNEDNTLTGWAISTWATSGGISSDRENVIWAGTISKLYWRLKTAPGSDNSRALILFKRTWLDTGVNTDITSTISNTDLAGNDAVNSVAIVDYDSVRMKTDPTSSPATPYGVFWGLVYIVDAPYNLYPALATSRITGIRHVYRPGSYRIEATYGDVSVSSKLAQRDLDKITVAPGVELPKDTAKELVDAWESIPGYPKDAWEKIPGYPEEPEFDSRLGISAVPEDAKPLFPASQISPTGNIFKDMWRQLTPWKEEKGKTFGDWWESLFGG